MIRAIVLPHQDLAFDCALAHRLIAGGVQVRPQAATPWALPVLAVNRTEKVEV